MNVDTSVVLFRDIGAEEAAFDPLCLALKALAEPQRLRMFDLLFAGERCVCDIEQAMHLPQNLVSHHLRNLREAGLVEMRRDGRWAYYRINKQRLAMLRPVLGDLFDPGRVIDAPANC